jgi:multidrug efflux pump subunit AcrA (membrane-fusion protein)
MAAWKQFLIAAVIMVAAAAAWVRFFPGAPEMLASWGMEWALAATPKLESPADSGPRQGRGGPGIKTAVVTRPVVPATINDKLSAIGTGRANKSVTVKPYSAGRLTELVVASGSRIRAGDVIAKLDSDAEEIAVDRARIAMADAEARVERIKALRSSNTATAVQMTEAELALGNARLGVRDAELALERRSIVAPISGIVGILPVEAGNYVATETAVATLDDRSSIIVDFWVPERYASAITVGMPMSATSIARPNQVFEGAVSAVDNRLDEAGRHVLPGLDAFCRRHLPVGRSSGHPVGCRRSFRLGDWRGRQGQAHAGSHRPAQHGERPDRRGHTRRRRSGHGGHPRRSRRRRTADRRPRTRGIGHADAARLRQRLLRRRYGR